jgi:outer membrane protein
MRNAFRAGLTALALVAVAGSAQAQTKIAYVNTAVVLENAPGREAAAQVFNKEADALRGQLQKMADSLQKLVTAYTKAEPTMTAAKKDAEQKKLQDLQLEFQAKEVELNNQAGKRRDELWAPIREQVRKVLEDIRAEDGYAVIFENSPDNSVIVAADKNLDITDRVVARLKTLAATGKAPTTPAAGGPAGVTKRPPAQ